jgi:hypothetical protein
VHKAGKGGMATQVLLYGFLARMTNRAVVFALLRYLWLMNIARRVLPILAGLLLWIGAAPKPPVLLRVHLQAPEGAKGQVSVPVTLFNPAETISIQTIPEVSEKEVRKVSTRLDGSILVEFTDFGQTKLEVGTSTGRGLILVVIVNGRVVYAPRIDTVLTNGCLLLPAGSITLEEMAQINGDVEHAKEQRLKDLPR